MPLSFSLSSPLPLSLSLFLSLSLALSLFRSLWQKMRDSRGPVHGFLLNFVARERRCPMSEHGEEEARRSVHRAGRNSSFSLGCHLAEKPYENKDVRQFAKKIVIPSGFCAIRHVVRMIFLLVYRQSVQCSISIYFDLFMKQS